MKQLRILTGRHAGTQLPLAAGCCTVGAGDEVDLQITDWAMPVVVLECADDGAVTVKPQEEPEGAVKAAAPPAALADFLPRRFGDIVLCVGPAADAWPPDVELMSRLMFGAPPAPEPTATKRRWVAGFAFVVLASGISASIVSQTRAAHTPPPAPPTLLDRVMASIEPLALNGITVAEAGDRIVVQGLLAHADEAARLHRQLAALPADRIEHRYAPATDVGNSIADALGQGRLAVSYRGDGVFEVTGEARDLPKTRDAAQRIASDLAPLVKRIDVSARAAPPTERLSVGAALAADGLQYVQTRDGAKHLSIEREAPVAASSAKH